MPSIVPSFQNATQLVSAIKYKSKQLIKIQQSIITETPVLLTVNGDEWLTFMCTPIDIEALGIGFLFNEKIIRNIEEVKNYQLCANGTNLDVWLDHSTNKPENWRLTSGCAGGITSINQIENQHSMNRITDIDVNSIGDLVSKFNSIQSLYQKSGGVHSSALSNGDDIIVVCEDVGRHNTLDKIAGKLLIDQIFTNKKIILTTGRISSEMIQKTAQIESSLIISRSSPTSLSIQLAIHWGICLIGYATPNSFRIYTFPERIKTA